MSLRKPDLWVVSKNIDKYKGSLASVGLGLAGGGAATGETKLFGSTVHATDAASFIDHHKHRHHFARDAAPPPLVLLLGTDIPNTADLIEQLFRVDAAIRDRVKWIHTLSTGVDLFQFHRYRDVIGSIPVSNAPGVFSSNLAEHIVFALLYFNRSVWRLQANRAARVYDRYSMVPLRGQTVGIVGYGNIAQACVAALAGLGVRAVGLRRSAPAGWSKGFSDEHGVEIVVGADGFDQIVRECDFVLNVLPATSENRHLFNKAVFAQMKPSAVYLNLGRGMTHNEDDLAEALSCGVIRGAAVDVFEVEPLASSSPLWGVGDDKLLLSPHNAGITDEVHVESANYFLYLAEKFVVEGVLPEYPIDIHDKGY